MKFVNSLKNETNQPCIASLNQTLAVTWSVLLTLINSSKVKKKTEGKQKKNALNLFLTTRPRPSLL